MCCLRNHDGSRATRSSRFRTKWKIHQVSGRSDNFIATTTSEDCTWHVWFIRRWSHKFKAPIFHPFLKSRCLISRKTAEELSQKLIEYQNENAVLEDCLEKEIREKEELTKKIDDIQFEASAKRDGEVIGLLTTWFIRFKILMAFAINTKKSNKKTQSSITWCKTYAGIFACFVECDL